VTKVLVAYATRHGSTRGIAERIAERLRDGGLEAESRPVADVHDASAFDAFVVGAAAYMFHWLGGATSFVEHNRATLAGRPTWLFSSGPIGTDLVDKEGRDVLEATVPKEFPRLRELVRPARRARVLRGDRPGREADRDRRAAHSAHAGGSRRAAQGGFPRLAGHRRLGRRDRRRARGFCGRQLRVSWSRRT
jgi:hypothetical protein